MKIRVHFHGPADSLEFTVVAGSSNAEIRKAIAREIAANERTERVSAVYVVDADGSTRVWVPEREP